VRLLSQAGVELRRRKVIERAGSLFRMFFEDWVDEKGNMRKEICQLDLHL